jgi:hypothetical protein
VDEMKKEGVGISGVFGKKRLDGDAMGGQEKFERNEKEGDSAGAEGVLMGGSGKENEEHGREECHEQFTLAGTVQGKDAENGGENEDAGDGTARVREEFPGVFKNEARNLEGMRIVDEGLAPVIDQKGITLGANREEIKCEKGEGNREVDEEIAERMAG